MIETKNKCISKQPPTKEESLHNHIHVAVRIKPLTEEEKRHERAKVWHVVNETTIADKVGREHFHFDRVFTHDQSTAQIYEKEI